MTELILKYRPKSWDEVYGQEHVAASVHDALAEGKARAFIFTGPSGVGKTTLARLIALELGIDVDSAGYSEFDGGAYTSVDDMRTLKAALRLVPLGGNGKRVVCVDEAHMLSKSAWNSILKDVEEPPEGVYWVFCTTEASKIPQAIRTRCHEHDLKPVSEKKMAKLLEKVLKQEDLEISDAVFDMLLDTSHGSPRMLLVGLGKVSTCKDDAEAAKLLATVGIEGDKDVADFCRALQRGARWRELMEILDRMDSPSAEGLRNVICAWFTSVARRAKDEKQAANAVAILDVFHDPYPPANGLHPVLVSLGQLMLEV